MKRNQIREEQLRALLKQDGIDTPSDQFTDQLTSLIVERYQHREIAESATDTFDIGKWLGKAIMGLLVLFLAFALSFIFPLLIKSTLSVSILAFIVGLWFLIAIARKILVSKIETIKGL